MSAEPDEAPPCPTDHAELESLLASVVAALEAGARDEAADRWSRFDAALTAHFDEEERISLAPLLVKRPREATVLLEEHRHLRRRATQVGAPLLGPGALRGFLEELRAHGRHEDRVFSRWAYGDGMPGSSTCRPSMSDREPR